MLNCAKMFSSAGTLAALITLFAAVHAAPSPGCTLNTNKDLPKKNEPLLFIRDTGKVYRFIMPQTKGKQGFLHLKSGQELVLSCPGPKNYINETKDILNHAKCQSGRLLTINEKVFESEVLDCYGRAAASIKKTDEKCHKGHGTILEIGFKSEGWHPLVTVCHNIQKSQTYYTTHKIHGAVLPGKVYRNTGRPSFSRGEKYLFVGFNPEKTYNKNNQKDVANEVFGEHKANEYLDDKLKFMARGHLAPDADFLFSAWQMLTYFYINVAPQWQSINAGHWLSVETNSRKIATKLGVDIEVATGTNGVLKLKGKNGKDHELYLHGDSKVPVPEYYWKLLHNPHDNSCMGFIATNNPHLTASPKHKCKDVCEQYGWPVLQDDLFRGYVYCCEYDAFKKVIPEVPEYNCKHPLKF